MPRKSTCWSLMEAAYPVTGRNLSMRPRRFAVILLFFVQLAAVFSVALYTMLGSACVNEFTELNSNPRAECVERPLSAAERARTFGLALKPVVQPIALLSMLLESGAGVFADEMCASADGSTVMNITDGLNEFDEPSELISWQGSAPIIAEGDDPLSVLCTDTDFAIAKSIVPVTGLPRIWLMMPLSVSQIEFYPSAIEQIYYVQAQTASSLDEFDLPLRDINIGISRGGIALVNVQTERANGTVRVTSTSINERSGRVRWFADMDCQGSVLCERSQDIHFHGDFANPADASGRSTLVTWIERFAVDAVSLPPAVRDAFEQIVVKGRYVRFISVPNTPMSHLRLHVEEGGVALLCRDKTCQGPVERFATAAAISFGVVGAITLASRLVTVCHKERDDGSHAVLQTSTTSSLFPYLAGRFEGRPKPPAVALMVLAQLVALIVCLWYVVAGENCIEVFSLSTRNPRVGCATGRSFSAIERAEIFGVPPIQGDIYGLDNVHSVSKQGNDWMATCAVPQDVPRVAYTVLTSIVDRNGTLISNALCQHAVERGPPSAIQNFSYAYFSSNTTTEISLRIGAREFALTSTTAKEVREINHVCVAENWAIIEGARGDAALFFTTVVIQSSDVVADLAQVQASWFEFIKGDAIVGSIKRYISGITIEAPVNVGGIIHNLGVDSKTKRGVLDLKFSVESLGFDVVSGLAGGCWDVPPTEFSPNCTAPLRIIGFRMWVRPVYLNLSLTSTFSTFLKVDEALLSMSFHLDEATGDAQCAQLAIELREGDNVGVDCLTKECSSTLKRFSEAVPLGLALVGLLGLGLRLFDKCFETIPVVMEISSEYLGPVYYIAFCFPLIATREHTAGPRKSAVLLSAAAQTAYILWIVAYTLAAPTCFQTYGLVTTQPPRLRCTERSLTNAERSVAMPGTDASTGRLPVFVSPNTVSEASVALEINGVTAQQTLDAICGGLAIENATAAALGVSSDVSLAGPVQLCRNETAGWAVAWSEQSLSTVVVTMNGSTAPFVSIDASSLDIEWWQSIQGLQQSTTVSRPASGLEFGRPLELRNNAKGTWFVETARATTPGGTTAGPDGWRVWNMHWKGPYVPLFASAVQVASSVRLFVSTSAEAASVLPVQLELADVETFCATETCESQWERASFAVAIGMTVLGLVFYFVRWGRWFHIPLEAVSHLQSYARSWNLSVRGMMELTSPAQSSVASGRGGDGSGRKAFGGGGDTLKPFKRTMSARAQAMFEATDV